MKQPVAALIAMFAVFALTTLPAAHAWADDETKAEAPVDEDSVVPLRDNLKKMEAQLRRMELTTNPKVRQLLLAQYLKSARENLAFAQQMQPNTAECPTAEAPEPATPSPEAVQRLESRLDLIEIQLDKMLNERALGIGSASGNK